MKSTNAYSSRNEEIIPSVNRHIADKNYNKKIAAIMVQWIQTSRQSQVNTCLCSTEKVENIWKKRETQAYSASKIH